MRWASRNRLAPLLALIVAVVSAAGWIGIREAGGLEVLENDTIDARFDARPDNSPDDVAVVGIDDVTLDELNERPPFPRSYHAEVLDRLREAGAKLVIFDIQFTEPTEPEEDNALIEAVDRASPVVLGTTEVDPETGETNVFGGQEVLDQIGARAGHAFFDQDAGGVVRRAQRSQEGLDTMAVVAADLVRGRPLDRDRFDNGDVWIDWLGPPGTVPTYSFSRVQKGRFPANAFRDRIVVVGAVAPRLQDTHPVPTGDDLMPGPEIHANAVSTLLRGVPLRRSDGWLSLLIVALMACVAPAAALRTATPRMVALVAAVGVGYAVLAALAFRQGLILPVVHPVGALLTAAFGALGVAILLGTLERQRVRDAFARFVPEAVVSEVLAKAGEDLRLGGVRRDVTVLFSDLRGFTAFSEPLAPDRVIEVLNHYLSSMSDAILDHGGTLVAYMGDGIMAVFGAPLERDDHAEAALAAAREMAGPRLTEFNAWLAEQGEHQTFEMGIGLNSGFVMSGNVGSARRLEYAAIGDTTNTANRLEQMTKDTPHQVFVSDATLERLAERPADLVDVGELDVRGRVGCVRVWAVGSLDKARRARAEAGPSEETAAG